MAAPIASTAAAFDDDDDYDMDSPPAPSLPAPAAAPVALPGVATALAEAPVVAPIPAPAPLLVAMTTEQKAAVAAEQARQRLQERKDKIALAVELGLPLLSASEDGGIVSFLGMYDDEPRPSSPNAAAVKEAERQAQDAVVQRQAELRAQRRERQQFEEVEAEEQRRKKPDDAAAAGPAAATPNVVTAPSANDADDDEAFLTSAAPQGDAAYDVWEDESSEPGEADEAPASESADEVEEVTDGGTDSGSGDDDVKGTHHENLVNSDLQTAGAGIRTSACKASTSGRISSEPAAAATQPPPGAASSKPKAQVASLVAGRGEGLEQAPQQGQQQQSTENRNRLEPLIVAESLWAAALQPLDLHGPRAIVSSSECQAVASALHAFHLATQNGGGGRAAGPILAGAAAWPAKQQFLEAHADDPIMCTGLRVPQRGSNARSAPYKSAVAPHLTSSQAMMPLAKTAAATAHTSSLPAPSSWEDEDDEVLMLGLAPASNAQLACSYDWDSHIVWSPESSSPNSNATNERRHASFGSLGSVSTTSRICLGKSARQACSSAEEEEDEEAPADKALTGDMQMTDTSAPQPSLPASGAGATGAASLKAPPDGVPSAVNPAAHPFHGGVGPIVLEALGRPSHAPQLIATSALAAESLLTATGGAAGAVGDAFSPAALHPQMLRLLPSVPPSAAARSHVPPADITLRHFAQHLAKDDWLRTDFVATAGGTAGGPIELQLQLTSHGRPSSAATSAPVLTAAAAAAQHPHHANAHSAPLLLDLNDPHMVFLSKKVKELAGAAALVRPQLVALRGTAGAGDGDGSGDEDEDEDDEDNEVLSKELARFNISGDKHYSQKKRRGDRTALTAKHATPALTLALLPTKLSDAALTRFHRPRATWSPPEGQETKQQPATDGELVTLVFRSLSSLAFSCKMAKPPSSVAGQPAPPDSGPTLQQVMQQYLGSKMADALAAGSHLQLWGQHPLRRLDPAATVASQGLLNNTKAVIFCVPTALRLLHSPTINILPPEHQAAVHPPGAFSRVPEISPTTAGHVVLLEYMEEHPPLLGGMGMGAQLVTFYQKKSNTDTFASQLMQPRTRQEAPGAGALSSAKSAVDIPGATAEWPLGDPRTFEQWKLGHVMPMDPHEEAQPFIAALKPGAAQLSVITHMFKAPAAPHDVAPTDFLLVRSPQGVLSLRALTGTVAVGQEHPQQRVLLPVKAEVEAYLDNRLLVHVARVLRGRMRAWEREKAKAPKADEASQMKRYEKELNSKRIKLSEIRDAFPEMEASAIDLRLRNKCGFMVVGKAAGGEEAELSLQTVYELGKKADGKDGEPLEEAELKRVMPPDVVCGYESARAAIIRLHGLGLQSVEKLVEKGSADPHRMQEAARQLAETYIKVGQPQYAAAVAVVTAALEEAPWTSTHAYMHSFVEGKTVPKLDGPHDPTGRGAGFSFSLEVNARAEGKKIVEQVKPQDGAITGTDADLRKISNARAKQMILDFGVDPEILAQVTGRWDRIALIRKLSTTAALSGRLDLAGKFARNERQTLADQLVSIQPIASRILQKQIAAISYDQDPEQPAANNKLSAYEKKKKEAEEAAAASKAAAEAEAEEAAALAQMQKEGLVGAGGASGSGATAAGGKKKDDVKAGTKRLRRIITIALPDGTKVTKELIYTDKELAAAKDLSEGRKWKKYRAPAPGAGGGLFARSTKGPKGEQVSRAGRKSVPTKRKAASDEEPDDPADLLPASQPRTPKPKASAAAAAAITPASGGDDPAANMNSTEDGGTPGEGMLEGAEPVPKPAKKARADGKPKKEKRAAGAPPVCGECGKEGHNAWNCPDNFVNPDKLNLSGDEEEGAETSLARATSSGGRRRSKKGAALDADADGGVGSVEKRGAGSEEEEYKGDPDDESEDNFVPEDGDDVDEYFEGDRERKPSSRRRTTNSSGGERERRTSRRAGGGAGKKGRVREDFIMDDEDDELIEDDDEEDDYEDEPSPEPEERPAKGKGRRGGGRTSSGAQHGGSSDEEEDVDEAAHPGARAVGGGRARSGRRPAQSVKSPVGVAPDEPPPRTVKVQTAAREAVPANSGESSRPTMSSAPSASTAPRIKFKFSVKPKAATLNADSEVSAGRDGGTQGTTAAPMHVTDAGIAGDRGASGDHGGGSTAGGSKLPRAAQPFGSPSAPSAASTPPPSASLGKTDGKRKSKALSVASPTLTASTLSPPAVAGREPSVKGEGGEPREAGAPKQKRLKLSISGGGSKSAAGAGAERSGASASVPQQQQQLHRQPPATATARLATSPQTAPSKQQGNTKTGSGAAAGPSVRTCAGSVTQLAVPRLESRTHLCRCLVSILNAIRQVGVYKSWFNDQPTAKFGLTDYYEFVSRENEMWLLKIEAKAKSEQYGRKYSSVKQFMDDVAKIRQNAVAYNSLGCGYSANPKVIPEADKLVEKAQHILKRFLHEVGGYEAAIKAEEGWVECSKEGCKKWRIVSPETASQFSGDHVPFYCQMLPGVSCETPSDE